jgi:hypothetical protein
VIVAATPFCLSSAFVVGKSLSTISFYCAEIAASSCFEPVVDRHLLIGRADIAAAGPAARRADHLAFRDGFGEGLRYDTLPLLVGGVAETLSGSQRRHREAIRDLKP